MSYFKLFKEEHQSKASKSLKIIVFNGEELATIDDLYEFASKELHFPDYFGKNLDGLFEVLCDLSWIKERRIELVLTNYHQFLSKEDSELRLELLNLLHDVADEWEGLDDEKIVKLFIQSCETAEADLEELGFI